jgi:hypothetical protein
MASILEDLTNDLARLSSDPVVSKVIGTELSPQAGIIITDLVDKLAALEASHAADKAQAVADAQAGPEPPQP